jgi:hypothetical protein
VKSFLFLCSPRFFQLAAKAAVNQILFDKCSNGTKPIGLIAGIDDEVRSCCFLLSSSLPFLSFFPSFIFRYLSFFSQVAAATATISAPFEVPMISPAARANFLTDRDRYPYFLRTSSNYKHEASALMSVVQSHGWIQIVYLHSDDETGRSLSSEFVIDGVETTDMAVPVCFAYFHCSCHSPFCF